jgi:(p)ppGpp synthase/HD superfamily hydrolase
MQATPSSQPAQRSCPPCAQLNLIVNGHAIAGQAYRGIKRADGQDYSEHPIEVVRNLVEVGIYEAETLAAAYLHDALEKGPPSIRALISADLGDNVLHLVEMLTDDPKLSGEAKRGQQLDRAASMPLAARQIKLADRLANLRTPRPDWNPEQRRRYAIHSYALLEALSGSHPELESQLRQRLSLPAWRL